MAVELLACEGLVTSSRLLIASSRSVRAVEAPCMGIPPAMETLVVVPEFLELGFGVDVRDTGFDLGLGFGRPSSDTSVPAADGRGGGGVADLGGGGFVGPWSLPAGVDEPDLLGM